MNFLMDNLIAAGKIKPFAIVMGNGMVKQRIDGELKLNRALYGQMLVEEILPMIEKKISVWRKQGKKRYGRTVHGFCTDNPYNM